MKVIIAGCRDFTDYEFFDERVGEILCATQPRDIEIISGGAKGVDTMARNLATNHRIKCTVMPADWDTHGKAAGPIRNRQMAEYGTHLIAFWDGKSRGTKNMIEEATSRGLKIRIINI